MDGFRPYESNGTRKCLSYVCAGGMHPDLACDISTHGPLFLHFLCLPLTTIVTIAAQTRVCMFAILNVQGAGNMLPECIPNVALKMLLFIDFVCMRYVC